MKILVDDEGRQAITNALDLMVKLGGLPYVDLASAVKHSIQIIVPETEKQKKPAPKRKPAAKKTTAAKPTAKNTPKKAT